LLDVPAVESIFQDGFEPVPPPETGRSLRVAAPAGASARPTRSLAPTQLAQTR
jgi:hypothetical protein